MPPTHTLTTPAITGNLLKRKWSVTILRALRDGLSDVTELSKREEDLSAAALNERLRTMLRYNLIVRHPRAGKHKVIDYQLTPKGRRILAMLELISQLDQLSEHDPRSLEEVLRDDLTVSPTPFVILSEPALPARGRGKPALRPAPQTLLA